MSEMSNKSGSEKLQPVTVRLSPAAYEAIQAVASERGLSIAHVVRIAIAGELAKYLGELRYIDQEQGQEIQAAIAKIYNVMSSIQYELHRIGVNYNQAIRLENIARKYDAQRMETITAVDMDALGQLMDRSEKMLKETGDILCLMLE